jgi:hypothetical protein
MNSNVPDREVPRNLPVGPTQVKLKSSVRITGPAAVGMVKVWALVPPPWTQLKSPAGPGPKRKTLA